MFIGLNCLVFVFILQVIQEVNNVLHVDLSKPPNTDIRDDCAMSVRDALVFMDLANYYSQSHPSVTPPGLFELSVVLFKSLPVMADVSNYYF